MTRGRLGKFDCPCPRCGPIRQHPRSRMKPVLSMWREHEDFATFNCVRCGWHGWVRPDAVRPFTRPLASRALMQAKAVQDTTKIAFANEVWRAAVALTDTPSARYLRSRGLPPDATDLRHAWAAPFASDRHRSGQALVAAFRDPGGSICAVQVIRFDGQLRKIKPSLTFGVLARGGAVRVCPVDGNVLAVAEGVETAMAFRQLEGLPTWATLGAGGMGNFQPPAGLVRLVVAADHDAHGRGLLAARALAERACVHLDVSVVMPSREGDWNDVLKEGVA